MINTHCEWPLGRRTCCGDRAVAIVEIGSRNFMPLCFRHIVEANVDPDGDRIWQLNEPIRVAAQAAAKPLEACHA